MASNIVDYSTSSFSSLSSRSSHSLNSDSNSSDTSSLSTKNRIVKIGNELLLICSTNTNQINTTYKIPKYLSSIKQFNSTLFLYFYETILGSELIDKKWPSKSIDDDIHNLQAVIDSLSIDILHEDLSHIQAQAICCPKPDLLSLEYLLDILRSIQEWISSRLDSMTTSSNLTNTRSNLSHLSPISDKKQKQQIKNKSHTRNSSRDSSTTTVSSLSNFSNLTLNQNKTKSVQKTLINRSTSLKEPENSIKPIKNISLTQSSAKQQSKIINFNSARSSSTPRSTVRSVSRDTRPNTNVKKNILDTISKRSSSVSSINSNSSRSSSRSSSLSRYSFDSVEIGTLGEEGILTSILTEFPNASAEVLNDVWRRYSAQINWFKKFDKMKKNNGSDRIEREGKLERYLKEAYRKQNLLIDLMRKELILTQRLDIIKRRKEAENLEKAKLREKKLENVRIKKYYDEVRLLEKSKLLKQKSNEEIKFKKAYDEAFKAKKEIVLDMRKYNRDRNEQILKYQMNRIESIENMYKTKIDLLNDQTKREKDACKLRENAHSLLLTKMKTQLKNKLENELKDLQEQMKRENEFLFFKRNQSGSNDNLKNDLFYMTNFYN